MTLLKFLHSCFFGFHGDPVRERRKKDLHFICPDCLADLGKVLPGQKFKKRKEPKKKNLRLATSPTAVVSPFAGDRVSATARRK